MHKLVEMPDIFNSGEPYNIKGKVTNYFYEGLLFVKTLENSNVFKGKQYIVDVKEVEGNEVTSFYSVYTFSDNNIPIEKLKGDRYLIIDGRPRFGKISILDDIQNGER